MDADLQRLLDEAACQRLIAGYGQALDWVDAPAFLSLFWPDAVLDYGFFVGSPAAFVTDVMGRQSGITRRFHAVLPAVIAINGDTAESEAPGVTHSVRPLDEGGSSSATFWGRYLDRFERRNGEWRLIARKYLLVGSSTELTDVSPALGGLPYADNLNPAHPAYRPALGAERR